MIVRPTTVGVRAIVTNDSKQILLVKHTYTNEWHLPGGKVSKGENLLDALKRELSQEIGLEKINNIELLGTFSNFYEFKSDYISVFIINDFDIKKVDHFEIEKISFFEINNMPTNISPGTKRRIEEYIENKKLDYKW
jgi:ADP-ribose pyrophosphatase YjhB (NUDIX family)